MFVRLLIALLFLVALAFAQDGESPDTVYTFANGFGIHYGPLESTYPGSFKGTLVEDCGGCTGDCYVADSALVGDYLHAFRTYYGAPTAKNQHARSYILFDTYDKLDTDSLQVDACTLVIRLEEINLSSGFGDGDSLWAVGFNPRCLSDCEELDACADDSCNFYMCGGNIPYTNTRGTNFADLDSGDTDTGFVYIPFSGNLLDFADTTGVGLVNKVYFPFASHNNPTDTNSFKSYSYASQGNDMAKMIYWYSIKPVVGRSGKNYGTTKWGI